MHVYFWLCLTAVKIMRRVDVLVLFVGLRFTSSATEPRGLYHIFISFFTGLAHT